MRAIFRDKVQQEGFERDGYVELDLLGHTDVSELVDLHDHNTAENRSQPVTFTAMHPDAVRRRVISDGIRAVLGAALDPVLVDCRPVLGNFFCKQPSSAASEIHIHQDWSFVDETAHDSLTAWCPLENVSRESGTLSIVPGSHRLNAHPRAYVTEFPYPDLEPVLKERFSQEVTVKPGGAVLFHQRLFHWSSPNRSNSRRLAANCFFAPVEASIVYPHPLPERENIELFEADNALLTSFRLGKRPDNARSLGVVHARADAVTTEDLARVLGSR